MRAGCHRAAGLLIVVALAVARHRMRRLVGPHARHLRQERRQGLRDARRARQRRSRSKAPKTTDELVAFADELEKVIDDGVRQLSAVKRPDGADGDKAERWINELTRQKDRGRSSPRSPSSRRRRRRKDTAAIQRAVKRIQQVDEQARSTSWPATPARAPAAAA